MGEQEKEYKGEEHEWGKHKGMGHMGGPGWGWMQMMKHRRGMGMMGPMGMMGMGSRCPECGEPMKMPWGMGGPHAGKGPLKRTDEEMKRIVEELLTKDSWLDASGVEVNVANGVVTLTGTVESRDAKRRAEDWADRVMGVHDVQNNLTITEPSEEE